MKTIVKVGVVGSLLFGSALAAATVDDFKSAAEKDGCESIPYSSLRSTCTSKNAEVGNWCKNSSKPISCNGLDPSGLQQQIENVKRKIEDLKRERDDLASKASNATDDAERRDYESKKKEKEAQIYQLEQKVEEWEKKLADEKRAISDRIYNGEYCVGYREAVAKAFVDAKSSAKGESNPDVRPHVEKLIAKWEREEPGHATAIRNYNEAVKQCRSMR